MTDPTTTAIELYEVKDNIAELNRAFSNKKLELVKTIKDQRDKISKLLATNCQTLTTTTTLKWLCLALSFFLFLTWLFCFYHFLFVRQPSSQEHSVQSQG